MKYRLHLIVFLGGFTVMALELVGARIVAPFLGTSTFVWTSIIGVILASLSFGYYIGGKVADKKPGFKTLSSVLFAAGILVGITAASNFAALALISASGFGVRAGSFAAALILFAPASVLFGMVSPLAAKIQLQDLEHSGSTIGGLYALSTTGSILGTFLFGFFMISFVGSTASLAILSAISFFASILAAPEVILKRLTPAALIFSSIFAVEYTRANYSDFLDIDTEYYRVWIRDDISSGRPIRYLVTSADALQSAMFLDDYFALAAPYTVFYDLHEIFLEKSEKALMLGGGAYSYPKHFITKNKNSFMRVVEIDPGLTEIARKHFGLFEDPRLEIVHEDARVFLNSSVEKYDVIFIDVFTSLYSIPYHVITREAVAREYDLLDEGGGVFVNIISAIEGDKGKLLRAAYKTYKSVFSQVYVFPISSPLNGFMVQNIMLAALKSEKTPDFFPENIWPLEISGEEPALTDDFAPVEKYVAEMF